MTGTEFKDAIRPFVQQYMLAQKESRGDGGHIFRIDSNTKGQMTRVVTEIFSQMSQMQAVENEVYL